MTTVIFQQIVLKTDQVKKSFAIILGEMYPVGLCLHILPDVFWHDDSRLLVGPSRLVFGDVRFLFERNQAGWISQQKVVKSACLLTFMGIPIMKTITASTAFYGPHFRHPLQFFGTLKNCLVRTK